MTELKGSGVCLIKSEYILAENPRKVALEHVSEEDRIKLAEEPLRKKQKFSKLHGQNKSRGPTFIRNKSEELCNNLINSTTTDESIPSCKRDKCLFLHDIGEYLKIKPKDIGDSCYMYETFGKCPRGLTCRFGSCHISNNRNKIDESKVNNIDKSQTRNQLKSEVQVSLRKRTYNFDLATKVLSGKISETIGREKKAINWTDKLFLSPLTTVGNLPFRRICKEFGADVTCGEMAMCSSLLQGHPQEWALVKRHHTEDIFGVQLCANKASLFVNCVQLLQEQTDIDFIDINLGCPIDLVYEKGAGCGLLRRPRVLEASIKGMQSILTVPLTIKTRTGIYSNQNVAHKFAEDFRKWDISLLTIHGRSREQRYTKSADWNYIRQVAKVAQPLPVLGNGDILSYNDYKIARESCPELSGIMIGRGALIKPWIFTEIKQQKLWDISSSERFDILKKFRNYGLEHWGSDNKGVENTRRFLLEWLSFLYRYIPVGLLEVPPQKINERPPSYKGRDDLETLMASSSVTDWIQISEMLLGKVPENFTFLPKHKANSYK